MNIMEIKDKGEKHSFGKRISRRKFLKTTIAGCAVLALSNLPKKARADNGKKGLAKYRFAMVIDLRRCVGCQP